MDLLFASDVLALPGGGAERAMLEWIDGLRGRGHQVRAVSLAAAARPPLAGYWRWRASHRNELEELVAARISERRPDLVIAQLHGAPGAQRAAARAEIPTVLVLPSYELLCKLAFDVASDCPQDGDCRTCPASLRLSPGERSALLRSRTVHGRALAGAAALIVPSQAMARTVKAWSGRTATVIRPVGPLPAGLAGARWEGPAVLAAARWSSAKGVDLLAALVAAVAGRPGREVRVTETGLDAKQRKALGAAGATLVSVGPIDEIVAGAALVLVPSQWEEPFGRIAWEAHARGIPVLASAAGGLTEQVLPEMLVSPRDEVTAWAAAIDRLLGDEGAWRVAATRAREEAAAVLDPRPVDLLEQLLRDAAGS